MRHLTLICTVALLSAGLQLAKPAELPYGTPIQPSKMETIAPQAKTCPCGPACACVNCVCPQTAGEGVVNVSPATAPVVLAQYRVNRQGGCPNGQCTGPNCPQQLSDGTYMLPMPQQVIQPKTQVSGRIISDYADAKRVAIAENLTLAVFVGQPAQIRPNTISTSTDVFVGCTGQCVVIGQPDGKGGLDRVPDAPPVALILLQLHNEQRARHGLAALVLDTVLCGHAERHAQRMAGRCFHSDLSTCRGENVAAGQRSPQEAVNDWMNSPGHRAAILNQSFTVVGFAQNGQGWVAQFR